MRLLLMDSDCRARGAEVSTSVQDVIEADVRDAVRRGGLDPLRDRDAVEELVRTAVRRLVAQVDDPAQSDVELAAVSRRVLDDVAGFGPLQRFFDDPEVEEVWINAPGKVFVARGGRSELTTAVLTDAQVRSLVERMLQWSGRRIDMSTPFVDAMLPDGSRLHVAIPDITREHWAVNIRRFVHRPMDVHQLVPGGTLSPESADFLEACMVSGLNVVVAGGTQAGKTTLLNALLGCIPSSERIVSCEEVFEIHLPHHPDWVPMQTRDASLEGTGEIPLRRLVKEALRMRPSRLIVGAALGCHTACEFRARSRHQAVHPAPAGGQQHRSRLRRAHCRRLCGHRGAHRDGARRTASGPRDRRSTREGGLWRRRNCRCLHSPGRASRARNGISSA
jgi:pilus assembly protein CpaF